jgi:UDP-N-acetylglucosamine 1-carboxyvinyltransferase
MDKLRIVGGRPLSGTISIGGAKNAALPLMVACLLTDETVTLANVPVLADVVTLTRILEQLGVAIFEPAGDGPRRLALTARELKSTTAPYDLVQRIRASILVLGPLLARRGEAKVAMPGGDAIGVRPVDLHVKGLARMGADIELKGGYIEARAPNGLIGADIAFPVVSVGATENLMMAATMARGETVLSNAAREPEVADLARCLVRMGADIDGIGTERLRIRGRDRLRGAEHRTIPDRIEAGTYALAAAIAGGEVFLSGVDAQHVDAAMRLLAKAGVDVVVEAGGLRVRRSADRLAGTDVMTEPFPGFPTDLQAQFMALMSVAAGASMITETIFENRFMHVPELGRLGANIRVHGASALVRGVKGLEGAPVMATDVRASVSLVLAGLVAKGETLVSRIHHLDRGYERLESKLQACGAEIERLR